MRSDRHPLRPIIAALLIVAAFLPGAGHAQVTTAIKPDATLGTTVMQSGNLYDINGGRIIGGVNQFHSFGQFSVGTGDIASFNGPAGIQNILSRVTGGNISQIDGTLRSTISGANLFLMNPSGILFGPNAQLNVSGSFHATTADYIGLADGARFNSVPSPADNVLTVAPPAAFGFLNSSASIDVTSPNPFAPLQVPTGATLSFVGGELNLGAADGSAPAYILAPAGTVNLVSVASGTATFNGSRIDAGPPSTLGNVNLRGGSIVDGMNVYIRGGRFLADNAVVIPGAFSLLGLAPSPDGGEVDVKVTGDVTFTGTAVDPLIGAPAGIFAFAGNFFGFPTVPAKVPDIRIEANTVNMSGVAGVLTNKAGPGTPADVVINANSVKIENGASVSLINLFEGPGDNLTVNAKDVELVGNGGASFTGLQSQTFFHPFYGGSFDPALTLADSGSITVNAANSLTVRGGAQITTDSRSFGRSGDITINAGNIFLSDSGGQISAKSAFAGDSGNVAISATGSGQITIDNGFVVAASTFGSGDSGGVHLNASKSVTISGVASGIATQTAPPPVEELNAFASIYLGPGATFADLAAALGLDPATATIFDVLAGLNAAGLTNVTNLTPGKGGKIAVTTPVLTVTGHNSAIDSGTAWDGNAGGVQVNVDSLSVSGGAQIRSRSGILNLVTGELAVGAGNAGAVNVAATGPISVSGTDSSISTTTFGNGAAGDILLSANQLNLQNAGSVTSASGGTVNGQLFVGAGNAGQITVSTPTLTMADGGTISVATSGGGNAGNISLNVANFTQAGAARVDSSTSGAGRGGDLTVTAANSVAISNPGTGLFSTASSTGNAGQISVSAPTLTMDAGGTISVATSGAGAAGNIGLNVGDFTLTTNARVDSGTTGSGKGGTVEVNTAGLGTISSGAGLFSNAEGSGAGGDLNVRAAQLQLLDGATISARSTGTDTARAGDVNIVAGSLLRMVNSSITTEATVADGGNISIATTGSLLQLTDSQITTSVQSGVGQGGNITIGSALHPVQSILLDGSQIRADAFGGPGGNIAIHADVYLTSDSVVSASSALSTPGTIAIQAQVTNVSGSLTQLPTSVLEAAALMRASCAVRLAGGKSSSLVLAGREGLPLDPSGLLPSPLVEETPVAAGSPSQEDPWLVNLLRMTQLSLDPRCSR